MGCDFRRTHGMLNPSPLSQAHVHHYNITVSLTDLLRGQTPLKTSVGC